MNSLYAGIDVSKNSNVTYLMKPDGTKHSVFSIPNDISGAKLLSERIVSSLESLSLSEVVIGMEATSVYGELLVYSLREDENLKRFQRMKKSSATTFRRMTIPSVHIICIVLRSWSEMQKNMVTPQLLTTTSRFVRTWVQTNKADGN